MSLIFDFSWIFPTFLFKEFSIIFYSIISIHPTFFVCVQRNLYIYLYIYYFLDTSNCFWIIPFFYIELVLDLLNFSWIFPTFFYKSGYILLYIQLFLDVFRIIWIYLPFLDIANFLYILTFPKFQHCCLHFTFLEICIAFWYLQFFLIYIICI